MLIVRKLKSLLSGGYQTRSKPRVIVTNTPGDMRPALRSALSDSDLVYVSLKDTYDDFRKIKNWTRIDYLLAPDGYINDWITVNLEVGTTRVLNKVEFRQLCSTREGGLDFVRALSSPMEHSGTSGYHFKEAVGKNPAGTMLLLHVSEEKQHQIMAAFEDYSIYSANDRTQFEKIVADVKGLVFDAIIIPSRPTHGWVEAHYSPKENFYFEVDDLLCSEGSTGLRVADIYCDQLLRMGASLGQSSLGKKKTFVFGLSGWKAYLGGVFDDRTLFIFPKKLRVELYDQVVFPALRNDENIDVFVWGYNLKDSVLAKLREGNNKLFYIEDGFIRSKALGATKAPGFSLTIDEEAPYFDATKASGLEELLAGYDFSNKEKLLKRAAVLQEKIISTGITKYNCSKTNKLAEYTSTSRKKVLVVGQVVDDASILWGCEKKISSTDLVRMAAEENPEAEILYRMHPDVSEGFRQGDEDFDELKKYCVISDSSIALSIILDAADHVYTITSLVGFEALLRGKKVTVVGCPFYSGWGLTDDRQLNLRRTRRLSILELLAGSYILYPKYFDPMAKRSLTAAEAIDCLVE